MNIKPLGDHILIEPVKEEEKTKAGIFLPETASKERSEEGKVIATGPGKMTDEGKIIPMSVKPGDKVYTGQNIALMGGAPGMVGAGKSTGCHVHFQVMGAINPLAKYPVGKKISY